MITSIDKAIAMIVLSVLFLLNNFTSFSFGVDESMVNGIVAVLAPILTYLVPNKVVT